MKITKRDVRLLLYVCGILVFIAAYFLIYANINEKNNEKEMQNTQLEQQLTKLQLLAAKQKEYKKQTDEMQAKLTDILNAFPADVRVEDGIAYGQSLESVGDMTVNGITIGEKNLLYTFGQGPANAQKSTAGSTAQPSGTATAGASAAVNTNTSTAASSAATATNTEAPAAAATESAASNVAAPTATDTSGTASTPGIYLYGQNFTYQFTSSYQGLKQVIDSVQKDASKKNIDGLSLSFDSESGLLIGTLSVTAFSLAGTDKVYEPVYLPSMSLGQDNLFGTINHTQDQNKK